MCSYGVKFGKTLLLHSSDLAPSYLYVHLFARECSVSHDGFVDDFSKHLILHINRQLYSMLLHLQSIDVFYNRWGNMCLG